MQDQELTLREMFAAVFRKWRAIVAFALIAALLAGGSVALWRAAWYRDVDEMAQGNVPKYAEKRMEKKTELAEEYELLKVTQESKKAQVAASEAEIEGKRQQNEQLKADTLKEEEQLKNSLYMTIDPYQVHASERFFRVDTGYRITPEMSYQTPDRTSEVMQAYLIRVNNTKFYEELIAALGLQDIDETDISELAYAGLYNDSSFRVRVVSPSEELSARIADYIAQSVLDGQEAVANTVVEHTILAYGSTDYTYIDSGIQARQLERRSTLTEDENAIYATEAEILKAQTENRDLLAEIRDLEKEIKLHKLQLDGYGFTPKSILTGFIKYAVFGGAAAGVLAAMFVLCLELLSDHVQSAAQCGAVVPGSFFGGWPGKKKKKCRVFAFLDRLAARLEGSDPGGITEEEAKELVLTNLERVTEGLSGTLLLCGGAPAAMIEQIAQSLREKRPGLEVRCGGDITRDAKTVRTLPECGAAVLVECCGMSHRSGVCAFCRRAEALGKSVLGYILA